VSGEVGGSQPSHSFCGDEVRGLTQWDQQPVISEEQFTSAADSWNNSCFSDRDALLKRSKGRRVVGLYIRGPHITENSCSLLYTSCISNDPRQLNVTAMHAYRFQQEAQL